MIFQFIVDASPSQVALDTATGGFWPGWIVLGFVVLTMLIVGLARLTRLLKRPSLEGLTREKILETWQEIEKTSEHGLMGAKLSVIEADKLLDGVFKSMAMPGETLGERLKYAGYKYPDIKKVWPAHRLRNQLVHDSAFQLSVRQAKGALDDYRKALKVLNVM